LNLTSKVSVGIGVAALFATRCRDQATVRKVFKFSQLELEGTPPISLICWADQSLARLQHPDTPIPESRSASIETMTSRFVFEPLALSLLLVSWS
jgi:hypothetical protein